MPRSRRVLSIWKPFARRVRLPRDFEKNKELLRIGVLSLVENDPVIFFTNTLCDVWQTEQFSGERDLIGIGDRASRESKIAIIPLHVRRHAGSAGARPFSQRPKRFAPATHKLFFCRRAQRPR